MRHLRPRSPLNPGIPPQKKPPPPQRRIGSSKRSCRSPAKPAVVNTSACVLVLFITRKLRISSLIATLLRRCSLIGKPQRPREVGDERPPRPQAIWAGGHA